MLSRVRGEGRGSARDKGEELVSLPVRVGCPAASCVAANAAPATVPIDYFISRVGNVKFLRNTYM